MIDAGDVQKPPTEQRLTPKQTAKTDADLKTLNAVGNYAKSKGYRFVVNGGYAVEAYCGGQMTRPHGDMDGMLFMSEATDRSPIPEEVSSLLNSEPTVWNLHEQKNDFIEFREADQEPKKDWSDKRRLELYYRTDMDYTPVTKTLIDSNGTTYEVYVDPLEELVSDKIRTMVNHSQLDEPTRIAKGLRKITETDKTELRRLLSLPEFDEIKCKEAMIGYFDYKSGGKMSREDAIQQAEAKWKAAEEIITS